MVFAGAYWTVLDTSGLGEDAPDMFVSKFGITIAIECKSPGKQRTTGQTEWAEWWKGHYLWGSDADTLLQEAEAIIAKQCCP